MFYAVVATLLLATCTVLGLPASAADSPDGRAVSGALLIAKAIAGRADHDAGVMTYFVGIGEAGNITWIAAGDGHCVAQGEELSSTYLIMHVHPWTTESLPGSDDFAACSVASEVRLVVAPDGSRAWQTEERSGDHFYREITQDYVGEWTRFSVDGASHQSPAPVVLPAQ